MSSPAKTGYLPTLDGWRAVAIISVVLYHGRLYSIGPVGTGWLHRNGYAGVDLFFAISGLLICWRLLEEEEKFGRISLRNFYVRRAFRILPPAIAFLGAIAILIFIGVLHIGILDWLGAVFFYHNYTSLLGWRGPDSYFVDQFWSLAVEEHFYLILPGLLLLTRKRWRLPLLILIAVLIEIHRWHVLRTRVWSHVLFHTGVRLDDLLIPAILAIIVRSLNSREKLGKWLRGWPVLLVLAAVLYTFWEGIFWQTEMVAVLLPLIVLGSLLNPHDYLSRILEWRPLRYVGRISYSVYLWQQLFFTGHFYAGKGSPLGIFQNTFLSFCGCFLLAVISYHLLERPLIRVGHKLAPPATPGRVEFEKPKTETPTFL